MLPPCCHSPQVLCQRNDREDAREGPRPPRTRGSRGHGRTRLETLVTTRPRGGPSWNNHGGRLGYYVLPGGALAGLLGSICNP
eukprot:6784675-Pyramimonas_sp.AAC.1